MKRYLLFCFIVSAPIFGQCGPSGILVINPITQQPDCTAVAGAGLGSVTSVGLAGTANQITVTGASPITASGSWTLSFPAGGVTLPGNTTGTFIGNVTGTASGSGIISSGSEGQVAHYTAATTVGGDEHLEVYINGIPNPTDPPTLNIVCPSLACSTTYTFKYMNAIGQSNPFSHTALSPSVTTMVGPDVLDSNNYIEVIFPNVTPDANVFCFAVMTVGLNSPNYSAGDCTGSALFSGSTSAITDLGELASNRTALTYVIPYNLTSSSFTYARLGGSAISLETTPDFGGSGAAFSYTGGAWNTNGLPLVAFYVQTQPLAVMDLPTCNSGMEGAHASVNDSNAVSFTLGIGAVVANGGTTKVPVYCDGTNWRIG